MASIALPFQELKTLIQQGFAFSILHLEFRAAVLGPSKSLFGE
jgi:hypothetical protein